MQRFNMNLIKEGIAKLISSFTEIYFVLQNAVYGIQTVTGEQTDGFFFF